MLTVKEYLDKRSRETYKRKIRVIDINGHGGYKDWTLFADRQVLKVSVTASTIFLYV
jgi:hypothetical protein